MLESPKICDALRELYGSHWETVDDFNGILIGDVLRIMLSEPVAWRSEEFWGGGGGGSGGGGIPPLSLF